MRSCLLALVATVLLASPQVRAEAPTTLDDVARQIREAAERLEVLGTEIATGESRRAFLEAAVSAAETRVDEREQRIAALATDIDRFDRQLAEFELTVDRESASLDARRKRLGDALRATRQSTQTTGLRVLLQQDDPALADRLGVYADYLLSTQLRAIDEQERAITLVETARERALKDRHWLEHVKRKADGQRTELLAARDRDNERLQAIGVEISNKTQSVADIKADRDRLQGLMDELEELQSTSSGYFAAGKGSYLLPVDGTITARFGDSKSIGRVNWNGLYVTARAGSPVRAVADGEIVYADRLRGFGLLVIVDHGDDFMTLYGGNREVTRIPGDWVEAGATIALVGDETAGDASGQIASGLYFEIRRNAKPVDPEPWLLSENLAAASSGGS